MWIAQLTSFQISGETFKDSTTLYFDFGDILFQIGLLTMSSLFWGVTWDEDVPFLLDFSSDNFIYFLLNFCSRFFTFLFTGVVSFCENCLLCFLSFFPSTADASSLFLSFCIFLLLLGLLSCSLHFLQPLASFLNCLFS